MDVAVCACWMVQRGHINLRHEAMQVADRVV